VIASTITIRAVRHTVAVIVLTIATGPALPFSVLLAAGPDLAALAFGAVGSAAVLVDAVVADISSAGVDIRISVIAVYSVAGTAFDSEAVTIIVGARNVAGRVARIGQTIAVVVCPIAANFRNTGIDRRIVIVTVNIAGVAITVRIDRTRRDAGTVTRTERTPFTCQVRSFLRCLRPQVTGVAQRTVAGIRIGVLAETVNVAAVRTASLYITGNKQGTTCDQHSFSYVFL
jgi:hypothetical protein